MPIVGKQDVLFDGRVFRVTSELVELPSGREALRETVRHPGSVAMLAFDDRGKVLLIRQFRFAVGGTIWEIPAGTLEPGERPLGCARRELAEETGMRARRWRKLTTIYPSPGILDERLHIYAAWDLAEAAACPQEDEEIEVHWVTMPRALSLVRTGRIADAKTVCALLYARQFGAAGRAGGR